MSAPKIRDLVVAELARNPGETRGHVIARTIGRPQSESTVYRVLRDLQGKIPTGVAPGGAGTGGGPAREDYQPRGLTRRRIEEWLDANPGESPSASELAEKLGLNSSTVGKNMRDIIKARDAKAKPKRQPRVTDPKAAEPAAGSLALAGPVTGAEIAAARRAQAAGTDGNGVTALLLRLQAGNVADIPLPPGLLIRMPGSDRYRDGVARDADGEYYELRRL